ncbi:hypothetical protein Bbelb_286290 [Branchiostoma belcheri]|nr:hypothetical protein Bbelb_286290 [Branchiostoma belcheri]
MVSEFLREIRDREMSIVVRRRGTFGLFNEVLVYGLSWTYSGETVAAGQILGVPERAAWFWFHGRLFESNMAATRPSWKKHLEYMSETNHFHPGHPPHECPGWKDRTCG